MLSLCLNKIAMLQSMRNEKIAPECVYRNLNVQNANQNYSCAKLWLTTSVDHRKQEKLPFESNGNFPCYRPKKNEVIEIFLNCEALIKPGYSHRHKLGE